MLPPFPFKFLLQRAEQVEERLTELIYTCYKREMQESRFDKGHSMLMIQLLLTLQGQVRVLIRETCVNCTRNNGANNGDSPSLKNITTFIWLSKNEIMEFSHCQSQKNGKKKLSEV